MTRHVVITGAGSGIGAALALAYAAPDVRLALCGRTVATLENVAAQCRGAGAHVVMGVCDVADASALQRWLEAQDDAQPIDVLIANAGIGGSESLTGDEAESGDVARKILAINTLGVVNTVTPVLQRFLSRKRGAVAIVSSVAGFIGLPDSPAYCASKAAATTYGDALRRLVRAHGVTVTVVSPGYVETAMSASLPFRRPFLWSAERAGKVIRAAIDAGRAELIFPWQFRVAVYIGRLLPTAIVDAILTRVRARNLMP